MRYIIIILVLFLCSCSDSFYLKKLIKHNPHLLDSTTKLIPYYKDTTIYITIYIKGDTNTQETKRVIDSIQQVYNDSFTTVLQLVDSIGNLKTTVIRKPYVVHDSVDVIIHDTIKVTCPEQFNLPEEKTPNYIWVLILIVIILFLLYLHRIIK